jgi:tetratricopeptide (TPR) repeat protein
VLEQLVRDFPNVPEYRHLLACCYRDMPPSRGPSSKNLNRDRAVELLRQLVKEFPGAPDYRLDLCEALGRPGPPPRPDEAGEDDRNAERLGQAVSLSDQLRMQYPNVPEYTAAHARCLEALGGFLLRGGQPAEAEKRYRQAVDLQEKLVRQYPEVVAFRCWLSFLERSLGQALAGRGELKEARACLEAAARRLEALGQKDPRLVTVRPLLGSVYQDLAGVLARSGATGPAAEARRKAEEIDREAGPFRRHDRGPPK